MAITYHAIIPLGFLAIPILAIVERVFRVQTVKAAIISGAAEIAGQNIANFIQAILDGFTRSADSSGRHFLIVIALVIIYAATNVFRQIKFALDAIWEVEKTAARHTTLTDAHKPFIRRHSLALLGILMVLLRIPV